MVNSIPRPKQGPPKIPPLYVDSVLYSPWLTSGPFIGRSRLTTHKDTSLPLCRIITIVCVDIIRDLYWLFEPRDPQRQCLLYSHTFITYISVDMMVLNNNFAALFTLRNSEHGFYIMCLSIIQYR